MFLRIIRKNYLQLIPKSVNSLSVNENYSQESRMILQTKASVLCDLLATESGATSHLDAVRDALILAQAAAFVPPKPNLVSNDRTSLPSQKR